MTTEHDHHGHQDGAAPAQHEHGGQAPAGAGHRGHGWMMLACCLPVVLIAGFLVLTGKASFTSLIFAAACPLMMVVMMRGMGHGGRGRS